MMTDIDVVAVLDQFEKDHLYIEEHGDEWLVDSSECWVAVYGQKLVGRGDTVYEALEQARTQGATENVAVRFLSRTPAMWIL